MPSSESSVPRRMICLLLSGLAVMSVLSIGYWVSQSHESSSTAQGTQSTAVGQSTAEPEDGEHDIDKQGTVSGIPLWQRYRSTWLANRERTAEERVALPLPDFSHAGYRQGEALPASVNVQKSEQRADENTRRFDVTDYGARGDDEVSDRLAVLKAHAAMRRWQQAGSDGHSDRSPRRGVLYFPAGDYVLYGIEERAWFFARLIALKAVVADEERQQQLRESLLKMQGLSLAGSYWTLAGAGSGSTHLKQTAAMLPLHASWYWSTPWLLHLGSLDEGRTLDEGGKQEAWQPLAASSRNQPADTQDTVMLADSTQDAGATSSLAVGDEVLLESIDKRPETVARALAPYQMEKDAKTGNSRWLIERDGVVKRARYRVVAREGKRLTLSLPLAHGRLPGETWRIARIHPAREVGVEGLALSGNWRGQFKHHRSAEDDSGFGLLDIDGVTDSWVRDVQLVNFNQGIKVRHSSQTTLENVRLTGKPGHIAMTISDSNQVLAKRVIDQSHAWHAPGVARYATHNVYLELEHAGDSGVELHGQQPRDTLFDQKHGGHVRDRWGASVGHQPNHLRGLVLWNPVNTGEPHDAWPFMRADSHYGKVIMPIVVGATGRALGIASQHDYARVMNAKGVTDYAELPAMDALQAIVESPGGAVTPASLYRAQRELATEKGR
ncbi:DUF4955 domain-containing protein [Cobetia crustatorum]|uniref:DUF4955 domain-containing protein n=1 Tax=Cobetia crustatorum TaxID=553385 RepID=UPI00046A8A26|nr:DUF4955 domain-containing protein [Cobetia crustatorum]